MPGVPRICTFFGRISRKNFHINVNKELQTNIAPAFTPKKNHKNERTLILEPKDIFVNQKTSQIEF